MLRQQQKVLELVISKFKGRVLWQTDGQTPEINSMVVIIDRLTKEGATIDGAGVTNKMAQNYGYC